MPSWNPDPFTYLMNRRGPPAPPSQGGGVPAPYPPPSGFRWDYVFESTATDPNVYESTVTPSRVVELVRIAA